VCASRSICNGWRYARNSIYSVKNTGIDIEVSWASSIAYAILKEKYILLLVKYEEMTTEMLLGANITHEC